MLNYGDFIEIKINNYEPIKVIYMGETGFKCQPNGDLKNEIRVRKEFANILETFRITTDCITKILNHNEQ